MLGKFELMRAVDKTELRSQVPVPGTAVLCSTLSSSIPKGIAALVRGTQISESHK